MNDTNQAQGVGTIQLLSWNVRGLNNPVKRQKVYTHIKGLRADIIFLQVTHVKHTVRALIKPVWAAQVFQSNFSTKTRRVAIIVKKHVPFIHKQTISDKNGRYLIVIGEINSVSVTLVNLYGPNYDDPLFFKKILDIVPDPTVSKLIIVYNCVLNPTKMHTQVALLKVSRRQC